MRKLFMIGLAVAAMSTAAMAVDFDSRACVAPNSTVFVSGMQRWVNAHDSKTKYPFMKGKASPTAVALGYEYDTGRWSAGISASFEGDDAKMYHYERGYNHYAKVEDRTIGFTLFGRYNMDNGYYAKGSAFIGFGRQEVDTGHAYDNGPLGSFTGRDHDNFGRYAASIEFGKDFDLVNGFRITPHAGFDYSRQASSSQNIRFASGAGANIYVRSQNFYEIPLGVTFAKDFAVCDWVLTPSVDLTMVTSVGGIKDENMNYRTGFASRTGSEWKVYGIGADHWGGRITAGIKANKSEKFDLGVNYAYEGRNNYSDHRLSATFGLSF